MATLKRKYVRPTKAQWAEIDALWELGEATLPELADKFGVSTRAIQAHFKKGGVVKGVKGRELAAEIKAELFSRAKAYAKDIVQLANETRHQAYVNASAVEGLLVEQLQIAAKSPSEAYRVATAVKTLSLATQTLDRIFSLKSKAIGLDKDDHVGEELPEIRIRYISNEEALKMREAQEAEDDLDYFDEDPDDPDDVVVIEDDDDA